MCCWLVTVHCMHGSYRLAYVWCVETQWCWFSDCVLLYGSGAMLVKDCTCSSSVLLGGPSILHPGSCERWGGAHAPQSGECAMLGGDCLYRLLLLLCSTGIRTGLGLSSRKVTGCSPHVCPGCIQAVLLKHWCWYIYCAVWGEHWMRWTLDGILLCLLGWFLLPLSSALCRSRHCLTFYP